MSDANNIKLRSEKDSFLLFEEMDSNLSELKILIQEFNSFINSTYSAHNADYTNFYQDFINYQAQFNVKFNEFVKRTEANVFTNTNTFNGVTTLAGGGSATNFDITGGTLTNVDISGNSNGAFDNLTATTVDLVNVSLNDVTIGGTTSNATLNNLTVNGDVDIVNGGTAANFDIAGGTLTDVSIDGTTSTGVFNALTANTVTLNGGTGDSLTITNSTFTDVTIDGINSNATLNNLTVNGNATFNNGTAYNFDIAGGVLTDVTILGTASTGTFVGISAESASINGGTGDSLTITNSTFTDVTIDGINSNATLNNLTVNGNATFNTGSASNFNIGASTFTDITIDGTTSTGTFNNLTATTASLSGGTVDNVTVTNSTLTDVTIDGVNSSASLNSLTSTDATFTNPIIVGNAINDNQAVAKGQIDSLIGEKVYGRNILINGTFDIWQRGTSFNNAENIYTADRWLVPGTGYAGRNISRQQFTNAEILLYNTKYFLRYDSSTAVSPILNRLNQKIEGAIFAGKTYTISFLARSSIADLKIGFNISTIANSANNLNSITTPQVALTTDLQKHSITFIAPDFPAFAIDDGACMEVSIMFEDVAAIFDITQIQLEEGAIATNFEFKNLAETLSLCKRYFQISGKGVNGYVTSNGTDMIFSGDLYPNLRVGSPLLTLNNTVVNVISDDPVGTSINLTSLLDYSAEQNNFFLKYSTNNTTIAANTPIVLNTNCLEFDAEL